MLWYFVFMGAVVFAALVWVVYMATCRTDDWLRLMKADQEWRQKRHERQKERRQQTGKAIKTALGVAYRILNRKK